MSAVQFYPQAVNGTLYPPEAIPMLPTLGLSNWLGGRVGDVDSVFVHAGTFFRQGRYAIAQALKQSGAGPGNRVLFPAFHCRSLVEPALHLRTQVQFYPLHPDLSVDMKQLEQIVCASGAPVSAIIITHYFGFPQDAVGLAAFCAGHNIALIEDCAHAFYGMINGRVIGSFGRFAAASPRKFFPVQDGGILLENSAGAGSVPVLKSQGIKNEVKALLNSISALVKGVRRQAGLPLLHTHDEIPLDNYINHNTGHEEGLKWYRPELAASRGLYLSSCIIKTASHQHICSKRADNYRLLLEGIKEIPGCEPLFPLLPSGVVPYAFPLLVRDSPEIFFHRLKLLGVPMWRWEDMAVTRCAVTAQYRLSLLQLPCHQGLTQKQIAWLVSAVAYASRGVRDRKA